MEEVTPSQSSGRMITLVELLVRTDEYDHDEFVDIGAGP